MNRAATRSKAPGNWEVVIGLETHAQLATQSKIFSGSSIAFGAAPNTQANPVDLALPGVLPVLNKGAVECAVKFGLAVGATIAERSIFARKNYFYPDLPKGYQISQFEIPVVQGGGLNILVDGAEKFVQLTRAHLEEDAGKSVHGISGALNEYGLNEAALGGSRDDYLSGIDLNRAGTPLLEIVTEPVMRSSAEAVAYAKALHSLVTWLGICDGNMQEGSFRCDANVSVRPIGQKEFGTRCEIKNLNSFRFMEKAIEYEVRRQIELIEDGGRVVQETRLYDPDKDETRSMRSKEDAMDYRYFPDPDLLPLAIPEEMIISVKSTMPELPQALRDRFIREYGFPEEMAYVLTSDRARASHFDQFWRELLLLPGDREEFLSSSVQAANWAMIEIGTMLNRTEVSILEAPISPKALAKLVARLIDGTISHKIAKEIFADMWSSGGDADQIIEAKGLKQISDSGALEKIVDEVLAANPKSVEEFRAGKAKAFNALVGQAMKASKGKANPAQINEILKRKLTS